MLVFSIFPVNILALVLHVPIVPIYVCISLFCFEMEIFFVAQASLEFSWACMIPASASWDNKHA